jgi:amino acid transporter
LAFINEANVGAIALDWLMAISGLSSFFAWGSICLCHVRFRQAWKAAGRSLDDLPFRAQTGVAGSYLALLLLVLCLIATFYVALFPIGGSPSAEGFFSTYLAAPVVITFFVFWKIWTRDWSFLIKIEDIDLDSGRRYENISATDGVDSTDLEETVGITRRVMKANA